MNLETRVEQSMNLLAALSEKMDTRERIFICITIALLAEQIGMMGCGFPLGLNRE